MSRMISSCFFSFSETLSKASLSKYYGKGQKSTTTGKGVGRAGDGMPVLARVLDLARPAVCALGPLMTHLEVSACWRHLFGVASFFINVKKTRTSSAIRCCFFWVVYLRSAKLMRDEMNHRTTGEGVPRTALRPCSVQIPAYSSSCNSIYFVGRFERMQELKRMRGGYVPSFRCPCFPVMLQRFGLDRSLASPDLVSFSQSQYMTLDAVTLRDLEVSLCTVLDWGGHALVGGLDSNCRTTRSPDPPPKLTCYEAHTCRHWTETSVRPFVTARVR